MPTIAPLPPPQTFTWPQGKRGAVSLTFDDARPSQIDRGLPILARHGVKATFFVLMSAVDQRLDGWRRAVADGHEIGNHTSTHPCSGNFRWGQQHPLESRTLQDMERELDEADARIRNALGVTPTSFAYPCGQTFVGRGEQLQSYIPLIARHFAVGRGFNQESDNDPAFCDLAHVTGIDFDCKSIAALKSLVEQTCNQNGWLVLAGHNVGDAGRQTVLADVLDELCRFCLDPATGVWIDSVAAVGAYVRRVRGG